MTPSGLLTLLCGFVVAVKSAKLRNNVVSVQVRIRTVNVALFEKFTFSRYSISPVGEDPFAGCVEIGIATWVNPDQLRYPLDSKSFDAVQFNRNSLFVVAPSFRKCARDGPDFNGCLEVAVEDAIKNQLGAGIPKLGVLALEPLSITQLAIGRGKGPISLNMMFRNLKIHGITDVKIKDQNTNLKSMRLESRSFNKQLVLEGDYEIDGKILLLPIRGKGKARIILDNVEGYNVISGVAKVKKGKTYLDIKKYDYQFSPTKMTLSLDNLFNGEKTLSDSMNRILNDNWEEVLRELKPSFEEALSEVFRDVTNKLYSKVPLDEIYPEHVDS